MVHHVSSRIATLQPSTDRCLSSFWPQVTSRCNKPNGRSQTASLITSTRPIYKKKSIEKKTPTPTHQHTIKLYNSSQTGWKKMVCLLSFGVGLSQNAKKTDSLLGCRSSQETLWGSIRVGTHIGLKHQIEGPSRNEKSTPAMETYEKPIGCNCGLFCSVGFFGGKKIV